MTTSHNLNTVFAVGISVNTTSRDTDTLDLLEISMATYNTSFECLDQTTAIVSHDPKRITLDGEKAKIYTTNGLLDDIEYTTDTACGAWRHVAEWLSDQLAHNEYTPHLFSDDLEFTHTLLRRHMPEILDYVDPRPIDITTVKLLAAAQGVDISLPERTYRAEDNVQYAAETIVQGYINAATPEDTDDEQMTTSKRVEQYTLPGSVIDTMCDGGSIAPHTEATQYTTHRNSGAVSAAAVLTTTNDDSVTVTVKRLSYDVVDIYTNTGKHTDPVRIHFTNDMTYDEFLQQVYVTTLEIAHDAIKE